MEIRNPFYGKHLKLDFFVDKRENDDLFVPAFGTAKCNKYIAAVDPTSFSYYSFHYVHKGKGLLKRKDRIFSLKSGDLFLIYPDEPVLHIRDEADPWEIFWVNFSGKRAPALADRMGFRHEFPILSGPHEEIFETFLRVLSGEILTDTKDLIAMGLFYEVCSIVCKLHGVRTDQDTSTPGYVTKALAYIEQHYFDPDLSIGTVANFCNINQSYLSRLFRHSLNLCFSHYLSSFRLQKAKELLAKKKYKVNEVAEMVGYNNPFYFSREFKKYIGMPPSDYSSNYTKSLGKET